MLQGIKYCIGVKYLNNRQPPTCYKFKRAESANMKRKTINKTTVRFDNEVGKFARQNL